MHRHAPQPDRPKPSDPHLSSKLPRVQLQIRRGQARNLVRQVRSAVYLIGTARDCDLVLADPQFPQAFAYLFTNESGVTIRRLGAGPELTVNGRAIEASRLDSGDRIRTGPFEFGVSIEQPARLAESAAPGPSRSDDARQQCAQRRVQHLLADIRHALFPPDAESRGFSDVQNRPHAIRRRAGRQAAS
jgi:pSer/pThr/pTyr-binding forkhead associated (FHA) protein